MREGWKGTGRVVNMEEGRKEGGREGKGERGGAREEALRMGGREEERFKKGLIEGSREG